MLAINFDLDEIRIRFSEGGHIFAELMDLRLDILINTLQPYKSDLIIALTSIKIAGFLKRL
jgi:hypothetical protein